MSGAQRAVVFDLDGTLIDSRGDIALACNFTLESAGRSPLPVETISGFVGDGARPLIERAFGHGRKLPVEAEELEKHLAVFLERYTAHPVQLTTIYPGVERALAELKGRSLALCTNKPRRTTIPVLEKLGLAAAFDVIVAAGDTPQKKPAPDPLLLVAEKLGLEASSLIMVGDGPQDIETARAVGALAIGVRGGLLPLERLTESNPDVLLDSVAALPAYLSDSGL